MTLHLTPDTLESAYELLRTTPPFNRWRLPHADDLEFKILVTKERMGHFRAADDGAHEIAMSVGRVHTLPVLVETMAHEMVHLRQHITGKRDNHGASFKKMAAQICKRHGFNPETF